MKYHYLSTNKCSLLSGYYKFGKTLHSEKGGLNAEIISQHLSNVIITQLWWKNNLMYVFQMATRD